MATRRITRRKTVLLFATSCIFVAVLASTCAAEQAASLSLRPLLLAEPLQRLRALSKLSDDDGNDNLTRPFGGPAHARAAEEIRKWFEDAGLEKVKLDAVGNVRGALSFGESEKEEEEEDASVLLLGSHYDTVRGAGIYDGALGIVAAVAAVKAASRRIAAAELEAAGTRKEKKPSRRKTVEVVAFSDEEGLRFGTTFLGSSALKGTLLGSGALDSAVDSDGVTLREALLELKEKERKKKESSTSSSPPSSSLDEDVAACALSSSPSSSSSSSSSVFQTSAWRGAFLPLSLSLLSLSIFPLFQCSDQSKIHEPSLATAVSRLDGSAPPGFSPSSSSSSSSKGTTMPPSPPISFEPLLPSIAALCDSLSFSEKHQGREIRERGGTRRNQRC